jgi:hypothetical protein
MDTIAPGVSCGWKWFATASAVALCHTTRTPWASPGSGVVHLEQQHVAAIAAAAVEVAARSGAFSGGRHHLEQVAVHRHECVVQAEVAHARVVEAHLDAEHGTEVVHRVVEFAGHEGDLAQAHGGPPRHLLRAGGMWAGAGCVCRHPATEGRPGAPPARKAEAGRKR